MLKFLRGACLVCVVFVSGLLADNQTDSLTPIQISKFPAFSISIIDSGITVPGGIHSAAAAQCGDEVLYITGRTNLQPQRDLHPIIYVVGQNNQLEGHINLEDLVLKHPKTQLRSILKENELVIDVNEDQQEVAQKMLHYGLTNAPVVNEENVFLGVITSEELVNVIEEEAGEDIYRMSAVSPIEETYFETPFTTLLYQRSSILIVLLLVQTFSTMIIQRYELLLCGFLTLFITMLTSTGGNASSQTSAYVIQGLATGEINDGNSKRFVKREFFMAMAIAFLLSVFSFVRIYLTHRTNIVGCLAVSVSLFVIVLASIVLGSCMPLILKRLNIDPARSAGPLLTTIIDVIGLLIFCLVSSSIYKLFNMTV